MSSSDEKRPSPAKEKLAKVLKLCVTKIAEAVDQKVLLLSRTGFAYGLELDVFRQRLLDALKVSLQIPSKKLEALISVMTAHGAKGQEAHTVIVLDATERQFPKVHPDNLLFRPFGVTPKAVLDEERRLFYVAITRAEHRLFVLTEKQAKSPYLYALDSYATDRSDVPATTTISPMLSDFALTIKSRLAVPGDQTPQ